MEGKETKWTAADWIFAVVGRWRKWVIIKTLIAFFAFYVRLFAVVLSIFLGWTAFLVTPDLTWKYWAYLLDLSIFPVIIYIPVLLASWLSWRKYFIMDEKHPGYMTSKKIGITTMMWLVAIVDLFIGFFDIYLIVNYSAYAIAFGAGYYWGWTVGIVVGCISVVDLLICRVGFIIYTLLLWTWGIFRATKAWEQFLGHQMSQDEMFKIITSAKMKTGSRVKYAKMDSDTVDSLL